MKKAYEKPLINQVNVDSGIMIMMASSNDNPYWHNDPGNTWWQPGWRDNDGNIVGQANGNKFEENPFK